MYGSGMRAATFANDMLVAGSYDVLDAVCVCGRARCATSMCTHALGFVVHFALPGVRNGCAEMDTKPVNLIWFIPA